MDDEKRETEVWEPKKFSLNALTLAKQTARLIALTRFLGQLRSRREALGGHPNNINVNSKDDFGGRKRRNDRYSRREYSTFDAA